MTVRWISALLPGLLALLCAAGSAEAATRVLATGSSTDLAAPADRQPTDRELEALVGPVALYPDELLAVVLAAATRPNEVAQAARYSDAIEAGEDAAPDPEWHESVVALLNYPEALARLDADLEWTATLGAAVTQGQRDVLAAVNRFRRKAYAAGNLASDHRQRIEADQHYVRIRAADPAVIYVPYYRPALVHHPQLRPVLHYHTRPCPVYYYPYPAGHYLASQRFWGLTGAFGIAWQQGSLYFLGVDHRLHPYYGREYALRHYRYWRPRLYDEHRYRPPVQYGFHSLRDPRRIGYGSSHWRFRDRMDARRDVPFGRPPAASGLSRLDRYRSGSRAPYGATGGGHVERSPTAPRAPRSPRELTPPAATSPGASSMRRMDRYRSGSGSAPRMKVRPH